MSSERPDPKPAADPSAEARKAKLVKTGVAVGIGSAAIVAALLYTNRSKRSDKN